MTSKRIPKSICVHDRFFFWKSSNVYRKYISLLRLWFPIVSHIDRYTRRRENPIKSHCISNDIFERESVCKSVYTYLCISISTLSFDIVSYITQEIIFRKMRPEYLSSNVDCKFQNKVRIHTTPSSLFSFPAMFRRRPYIEVLAHTLQGKVSDTIELVDDKVGMSLPKCIWPMNVVW